MSLINENGKVRILMGTYFSLNCVALSYVALYLGRFGLQDYTIGIIVSISAILGFILQWTTGRIIDTHPRWYWRNLLQVLGGLELIICGMILLGHLSNVDVLVIECLYGLFMIITLGMAPLVNSSSFYYTAHGRPVNFGVARGVGSVVFAAVSYIIGIFSADMGIIFIPICGVVFSVLFIMSVVILPALGVTHNSHGNDGKSSEGSIDWGFVERNKHFLMVAFGICMVLILHNMVNSFLIRMVENVGGSSDALGLALAIAAVCELPVLFLYENFVKRFKIPTLLLVFVACLFYVLRGIFYLFANDLVSIYAIQILQSVSFALLIASKTHFADEGVGQGDKARGQSIMSMTEAIAMVLGSAIGGWAISLGGVGAMYIAGIAFAVIGSLVVLVMCISNNRKASTIAE